MLVQRNQHLSIGAADGCSVTKRIVEGFRRKTDVIHDQVGLLRGNGLANLILHPAEDHLGGLDAGSRSGPDVQFNLSRIDRGKEISAYER